jgi:hypothetical protein
MKTRILFLILVATSLASCKKSTDPEPTFWPTELMVVNTALKASFDSLNTDMAANAAAIAQNVTDTAATRNKMKDLFNRTSFVLEFSYITPKGIMQIIEPEAYHSSEGSDISQQAHIIKTYQTKQPVLSSVFYAVEGFFGAVDVHPILNQGAVLGGITALFRPETILRRIIEPVTRNQPFDIFVMEKGGMMIYDQDPAAIGQNLITDTIFSPFPELVAAARLIDASNAGQTSYTYYQAGTTTKVVKNAYWITYELYGNQWKIIWIKPV